MMKDKSSVDREAERFQAIHGPGVLGLRRLLSRLRDVMAGAGSAQDRLDQTVKIIAADLVAEVCSVYLMRAGEVLELFATEGLKAEAVHKTRLRLGEGLIGDIAAHSRPLALAEAKDHPNFAYRPETGEEIYHSMMGVPIMRSGSMIGVLAVQNQTRRQYTEEEQETLETIAMVLAELVASGELVPAEELHAVDGIAVLPMRLEGTSLNAGVGLGTAVIHRAEIIVHNVVAEDPIAELGRLHRATAEMHGALDNLLKSPLISDDEQREILETYRMIAEDAGWLSRIMDAIKSGLTAEAAVQKVQTETRIKMGQITDPYLSERIQDFDDLANRLLQHLTGDAPGASNGELPQHVVIVAKSMGPAELMDYDTSRLRGLVLEEGSATSHVAIVARALDIPVLGRVKNLLRKVMPRDEVVVDGDHGQFFIRPSDDIVQAFQDSRKAREQRKAEYLQLKDLPSRTLDGREIGMHLNAGLLVDLQHLEETAAVGIGLYRTEIPFMARQELPDVEAQTNLYQRVYEQVGDKPVVFRTLDAGGDKVLPYWANSEEENPILGWRAIRLTLDRPAILRQQLRALIYASAGRGLSIMFPMIAEIAEFDAARRLVDIEMERAEAHGIELPSSLKVGAMLEVPSLLYQLPQLVRRVDFLSVGSNDLLQFMFASDRGNPRLNGRYDSLSAPVLSALRQVVLECDRANLHLSLCGEMAGRPLEAMTLIGLGFKNFSMSPPSIGPVKAMIRSMRYDELNQFIESQLDHTGRSLREKLRSYAIDHGAVI